MITDDQKKADAEAIHAVASAAVNACPPGYAFMTVVVRPATSETAHDGYVSFSCSAGVTVEGAVEVLQGVTANLRAHEGQLEERRAKAIESR